MKTEKQQVVMSILKSGIYEIDAVNALVYANRKRGKVLLKCNLLPSGYQQITLFAGRRTGIKVILYLHVLVYLAWHGPYDENLEISHEDNNKLNCSIYNLAAKTTAMNYANSPDREYPMSLKLIRSGEIADIRRLHTFGYSQNRIAKELSLNRLSVRYTIKRIEAGLPLKYEFYGPYRR